MRKFWLLMVLCGAIQAAGVQFQFYNYTSQKFSISYDTHLRAYMAPLDLITVGSQPMFKLIYNGSYNQYIQIDDIRFPSNAFVDFESEPPEIFTSPGITQAVVVYSPDDSTNVLELTFDRQHLGLDTLIIAHPESWYPAVPERAGVKLKGDRTTNMAPYFIPPDLARFDVNVEDWSWTTTLDEVTHEEHYSDSAFIHIRRLRFPTPPAYEVDLTRQVYRFPQSLPQSLDFNGLHLNFTGALGEYEGTDSTSGSWLVDEYYDEILGDMVHVKKFTTTGAIGNALYFAHGYGLIRQDFPGTSVHAILSGLRDDWEARGILNLPIALSLNVDYETWNFFTILPPDTQWYHYRIPLAEFYGMVPMPTTVDSLMLSLAPEILEPNNDFGSLLLNTLSLWENNDMVFNYSTRNYNQWMMNTATNGSEMHWSNAQEMPPGVGVISNRLDFGNPWPEGGSFAGFADFMTGLPQPIVLEETEIRFWLKQPYVMTEFYPEIQIQPIQPGISNAFPNPFNQEVMLVVGGSGDEQVDGVIIYDIQGREVWSSPLQPANRIQQIKWQGEDSHGRPVSSGIYLATLAGGSEFRGLSVKLLLLK